MKDIINLNKARKRREKQKKQDVASSNRNTFGRKKADRMADRVRIQKHNRNLDSKKLDPKKE